MNSSSHEHVHHQQTMKGQRTLRADFGLTDLTYESYAILYPHNCRQ